MYQSPWNLVLDGPLGQKLNRSTGQYWYRIIKFCVASTFTDSLAHLPGEEQKAVETTAFDLLLNPANPGMSLHKSTARRTKTSGLSASAATFG